MSKDVKKKTGILNCPILEIDATLPVGDIVENIYDYYAKLFVE